MGRHAESSQIPGVRCSTSAIQGHGIDEPEALTEALRRSCGLTPSVPVVAVPTAPVAREVGAMPAALAAATDITGESATAAPARPGPYTRASACPDDLPQAIAVRNTFIDVVAVGAKDTARMLRRARTEEEPSTAVAAPTVAPLPSAAIAEPTPAGAAPPAARSREAEAAQAHHLNAMSQIDESADMQQDAGGFGGFVGHHE